MKIDKFKKNMKNLYYRLTMSPKKYKYYRKVQQTIEKKEYAMGIKALDSAINKYSNNYQFQVLAVEIATKTKNWKKAAEHWKQVFLLRKRKPKDVAYIAYANSLLKIKEYKKAQKLIIEGLEKYPTNIKLKFQLVNVLFKRKQYKEVIKALETLNIKELKYHHYNILLKSYLEESDKESAYKLIETTQLTLEPMKTLKLKLRYNIHFKKWHKAIDVLNEKISLKEDNISEDLQVLLSLLYLITGQKYKANEILIENKIDNQKKYKMQTIFYNGHTKIEFYKQHKATNTLVVTFDSLNMTWKSSKPFGYQLLSRQDVDILAIRRETPNTQHQDISRDEFYEIVRELASCYEHKVAYGYSLGGYTSIYYGSIIDCTILSLAPRVSIHPIFGRDGYKSKESFKHELYLQPNEQIAPIVVYDPKQKLDNKFVEGNILKAFPNANLIKINYGGHGIAPHLLRVGQLKEFVLTVVNDNKVPIYNRKLKGKSNIYLRVLGQACLNKNKLKWANNLVDRSLELLSTDKYANRLKINVLKRMGNYEEALEFAYQAKNNVPKDVKIREYLIELMIQHNLLDAAKKELSDSVSKFGLVNELTKFKEMNKF